jgi:hypothetical protein
MTAAWVILRSQLRRRWRAWLAVALLVGAFAGAVETAAAGARRTDAAYPSLLTWSSAPEVMFFSDPGPPATFAQVEPAWVGRLPQVKDSALLAFYTVLDQANVELIGPVTTRIPDKFWHRKILAGRLPDPARAAEANISFTLAQARHCEVAGMHPGRGGPSDRRTSRDRLRQARLAGLLTPAGYPAGDGHPGALVHRTGPRGPGTGGFHRRVAGSIGGQLAAGRAAPQRVTVPGAG